MKLSAREEKRLTELLEKKEQAEKADRDFFKQCRKRRDEVLKALDIDVEAIQKMTDLTERLLKSYGKEATLENYERFVVVVERSQDGKDPVQSIPLNQ